MAEAIPSSARELRSRRRPIGSVRVRWFGWRGLLGGQRVPSNLKRAVAGAAALDFPVGPEGELERRNEELLRPIINEVQTLLAQLAVEEGYDFILDAADNNILYADPDLDITALVVDRLNNREGSD